MARTSTETLWRQWNLLRLMPKAPRHITAAGLCEGLSRQGLEVGKRTVERDLQNLLGQFPLVVDETARPFLWSWHKDANFDFMPRLTTSQAVALLLAQSHLRTLLPMQAQNDLKPIFQMAHKELSGGVWKDWHCRTAVFPSALVLLAPALDSRVLEDVHAALAHRRQLTALYRSKRARQGRCSVIHPLGLIIRGQVHYLACTLNDYQDVRQLALHRLAETKVGTEPGNVPEGFDFERYARESGSYEVEGEVRLVVHFTSQAADHLRETPLSRDQCIRELPGTDKMEVSATVPLDQPLRWWLKGFGSQVEVIAPAVLRAEMLADARAVLAAYESQAETAAF